MDGVSTPVIVLIFAVAALIQIGLGYLTGRAAARKGHSLPLFWLLGTFFIIPTAIAIVFLSDRTKQQR